MGGFHTAAIAYGFLAGPAMAQATTFLGAVRPSNFSLAYGVDISTYGVTSFIGPWAVGFMVDTLGGYEGPFYVAACLLFASSLLTFGAHFQAAHNRE